MPATKNKPTRARKQKFQADLEPVDENIVRSLKQELHVSNSDFLSDAVALLKWVVTERKSGRTIMSESSTGEKRILVLPHIERVAPEATLPHVHIDWTAAELDHVGQLLNSAAPAPTEALTRLMRG
jgi:hypothetical protein